MRIFFTENEVYRFFAGIGGDSKWGLRQRFLIAIIPPIIVILLSTGWITNWISSKFLTTALERNTLIQTQILSYEIEKHLDFFRRQLLTLVDEEINSEKLLSFFKRINELKPDSVREVAFIGKKGFEHIFFVNTGQVLREIKSDSISLIKANPFIIYQSVMSLKKGHVFISDITETSYPLPPDSGGYAASSVVTRLATPVFLQDGSTSGFILISLDIYQIRDILSIFISPQSPLHAFPRSPEPRYSYLYNRHGWMLFESENVEDKDAKLSTYKIRSGMKGTIGRAGLESAFRPNPENETYWKSISDVQSGKSGVIYNDDDGDLSFSVKEPYFLGYAPIKFKSNPKAEFEIIGGVGFLDRSRLTLAAEIRHIDIMFIITSLTIISITLILFKLAKTVTEPILLLSREVERIQSTGILQEIELPGGDTETIALKNAINKMIKAMKDQMEEIRRQERLIMLEEQREKVVLEDEPLFNLNSRILELDELVGYGQALEKLRNEILKASSVDVDVLITGETGTGKQLTAEAIHNHSNRRNAPFVTINCGALDENLLLDALFGHVKGAFSDAKTDRKGAFLAADGGTLFLDEIGNASPKVQQAILRSLSVRKVKPLGSDKEFEFDLRVVAATNEDLKSMIDKGIFREDLYYRLKVISIETPPLRDHKEDIPALAAHFLKEAAVKTNKKDVGLSKGALIRLKNYNWPGNVRELKNCIFRAAAMAESDVIYTEDIRLDSESMDAIDNEEAISKLPTETSGKRIRKDKAEEYQQPPADTEEITDERAEEDSASAIRLNERQRKILPIIISRGEITRQEYQELAGGIPDRTAQYDLSTLTKKGVLKKNGKGPATKYYPV